MRWVLGLILGFGLVTSASAEVPQQLHYNGYLTNAVGEAVECPDAIQCGDNFDLTFRLYDSEESDTAIWSETKASMSIYGGSFHSLLGSVTPITAELLSGPVWLAVKVNNNAEMLPRQQVASAAYAIKAGTVDYAKNAAQLGGLNPEDFASTKSVIELQTIIAGTDDDTLAALGCAPGQVAKASEAGWICADAAESDTTLSETQVDEMVDNNGYAAQSELEAAQAALAELQNLVNNIDTSTGVDITGLQAQIAALETSLEAEVTARAAKDVELENALSIEAAARTDGYLTIQGDISAVQANVGAEVLAREAADNAEATARAAKDVELENALSIETTARTDGDLSLQDSINALLSSVTSLQTAVESGGAPPESVMYLEFQEFSVNDCPPSWTEAQFGRVYNGSYENWRRTCRTEMVCSVMYLEFQEYTVNDCPPSWTEAQWGRVYAGSYENWRRTCYRCN